MQYTHLTKALIGKSQERCSSTHYSYTFKSILEPRRSKLKTHQLGVVNFPLAGTAMNKRSLSLSSGERYLWDEHSRLQVWHVTDRWGPQKLHQDRFWHKNKAIKNSDICSGGLVVLKKCWLYYQKYNECQSDSQVYSLFTREPSSLEWIQEGSPCCSVW